MRILFASPVVPWPPDAGGRIRTSALLREVGRHVELHLACVLAPGQTAQAAAPLRDVCASVRTFQRTRRGPVQRWSKPKIERWFHSRELGAVLSAAMSARGGAEPFDLVHLDEMVLARAVPAARPGAPRVCVHHHKLDTVLQEALPPASSQFGALDRAWGQPEYGVGSGFDLWKLRRLEAEAARLWEEHLVTSPVDAAILRARYPHLTVGVVENGFDPETFSAPAPGAVERDRDRVLFLGSLDYGPNVDAVQVLALELLPRLRAARPSLAVDLVGSGPTDGVRALAARTPGLELFADVEDVRPFLARAGALVVPLRVGGGTRLKIVEALAMGTPVVSTFMGAQGLELSDGEHLRLAGEPHALAAALLGVLADPDGADAMAERGRERALERYTWPRLAGRLLEHWRRIAAARVS